MTRAAIVLCGGASRRMGRDKATLRVGRRTLVEHVVRQLRGLVDRVVVSAAREQELPPLEAGVDVVRDDDDWPAGPLRGIAAGCAVLSPDELALVWACDCPQVEPRLVEFLFESADHCQAAVPRYGGQIQPLNAVYRVGVALAAARQLMAGGSAPAHRLAESLDTAWIEEDALRRVDPTESLRIHLNSPADYTPLLGEVQAADELSRQVLDWHERDRRLTAYEIHDGIVQDVTGALLRVEALAARTSDEATRERLAEIGALLRKAIDEGRRMIGGMRPPILDESGLVPSLQYLVAGEFLSQGLEVTLLHDAVPRGSELAETSVFRIVHEALTNVARHSGATNAVVELRTAPSRLVLEIRDEGRGFVPAHVGTLQYGLKSIRDRARILGGAAEIASQPGRGSVVRVWLPWGGDWSR